MKTLGVSLFATVFLGIFPAVAQAINCAQATINTETMICENRELRALDNVLNQQYRVALNEAKKPEQVKVEQQKWLVQVRAKCTRFECLKSVYQAQITRLSETMSAWCQKQRPIFANTWLRIGEDGFFEEFSASPDGEFDSWLHHRPEISGGTWKLQGCLLEISSRGGLSVKWIIVGVTKSGLRVIDADESVPTVSAYRAFK